MKVTKEVTFDCAHMLSGHKALCKNLHGHTYKVQICIEGSPIKEGSSLDMVIDFKILKSIINNCIKDKFDHALILSAEEFRGEAENELYAWAIKYGMRYYVMPRRTTAEDMAILFQQIISDELKARDLKSYEVSVRVYETPTSYAEV